MKKIFIPIIILSAGFFSCDKNDNLVIFSVEEDVALGAQVSEEIASDPQFNILSQTEYPFAYQYIRNMVDEIITSGEVAYKDEFAWEVNIIHNDTVLNAFATPGGYIYVYTGLIKYLDNADALAGVLGHEVAHADLRHTSRNLQKSYGVSVLLNILFGDETTQIETIAGQVAGTLAGLSFSREYEREADDKSVIYLSETPYSCSGAAIFFEEITAAGQSGGTPEFLSTHPNPDNRIQAIHEQADEINCETELATNTNYSQFQASLPD
jgi:predicted Zn-dependent protease